MEQINTLVELKNCRRVCKRIKTIKFEQQEALLAADMMFAHSSMDGKFKLMNLSELKNIKHEQHNNIIPTPANSVKEH